MVQAGRERGEQAMAGGSGAETAARPTRAERAYLRLGLDQPGGKLPLFDSRGQRISEQTIRACLRRGWAEPWFKNPLAPDWLVCRLTAAGAEAVRASTLRSEPAAP